MGQLFVASNNALAAEYHLRLAEKLAKPGKADAPDLQALLAQALSGQNRFDEARAIYYAAWKKL